MTTTPQDNPATDYADEPPDNRDRCEDCGALRHQAPWDECEATGRDTVLQPEGLETDMATLELAHQECAAAIGKPNGDAVPGALGVWRPAGYLCPLCGMGVEAGPMAVLLVVGTPGFDRAKALWEEGRGQGGGFRPLGPNGELLSPGMVMTNGSLGQIEKELGIIRAEMVEASQAQDLNLERTLSARYALLQKARQKAPGGTQDDAQDDPGEGPSGDD